MFQTLMSVREVGLCVVPMRCARTPSAATDARATLDSLGMEPHAQVSTFAFCVGEFLCMMG